MKSRLPFLAGPKGMEWFCWGRYKHLALYSEGREILTHEAYAFLGSELPVDETEGASFLTPESSVKWSEGEWISSGTSLDSAGVSSSCSFPAVFLPKCQGHTSVLPTRFALFQPHVGRPFLLVVNVIL